MLCKCGKILPPDSREIVTISLEAGGGILPNLHEYIIVINQRADYVLVDLAPIF